jgi:hypothetical protein
MANNTSSNNANKMKDFLKNGKGNNSNKPSFSSITAKPAKKLNSHRKMGK